MVFFKFCLQIAYKKVRNLQISVEKLVGKVLINFTSACINETHSLANLLEVIPTLTAIIRGNTN